MGLWYIVKGKCIKDTSFPTHVSPEKLSLLYAFCLELSYSGSINLRKGSFCSKVTASVATTTVKTIRSDGKRTDRSDHLQPFLRERNSSGPSNSIGSLNLFLLSLDDSEEHHR